MKNAELHGMGGFQELPSLEHLECHFIENPTFGGNTTSQMSLYNGALKTLKLFNFNLNLTFFNAGYANSVPSSLTESGYIDLFNSLPTVAETKTITISSTNVNRLSQSTIDIATAKNWVLQ